MARTGAEERQGTKGFVSVSRIESSATLRVGVPRNSCQPARPQRWSTISSVCDLPLVACPRFQPVGIASLHRLEQLIAAMQDRLPEGREHGRHDPTNVNRDWLALYRHPDGHRCRVPNAPTGHAALADLARNRVALARLRRLAVQNGISAHFWREETLQPAGATSSGEGLCAEPRHARWNRPYRCQGQRPLLRIPARSRPQRSPLLPENRPPSRKRCVKSVKSGWLLRPGR
jgi:hypothetical protein